MKICSLYGVGFYYIPGTDMCVKIGGWVRAESTWGGNGSVTGNWWGGNVNNRNTSNLTYRARGYITADARNQTEYGTVRGYIAVGLSTSDVGLNTAANQFSANRAFIQWAGFTGGIAQSFYDFYSTPATSYWGYFPASDTGDPGWTVFGYTAQFGNGLSASISAEERRMTQIVNAGTGGALGFTAGTSTGAIVPGAFPTTSVGATANAGAYGGWQSPDIIGNLRIDQAWGGAQIMGALHQVNANYYGAGTVPGAGHPSDKWGFAVGGGIKLNAPMIGPGDYLQAQVNYTQGALRYVFFTPNSNWGKVNGMGASFGVISDAVYGGSVAAGTGSDLQLTTAWNVNAAYEHFWNPAWRTSVYGGYAEVTYSDAGNAMLCSAAGIGAGGGTLAVATPGCSNNWSTYWVGSRTQWNVTKDFYMGVDVMYSRMKSGTTATGLLGGYAYGSATTVADVDNWAVRFRAHKDFYP
ncbi:porin [Microbacteriaceae bacterium K1510]|nr:porin [Microbacteriaceae bacterium K1510]